MNENNVLRYHCQHKVRCRQWTDVRGLELGRETQWEEGALRKEKHVLLHEAHDLLVVLKQPNQLPLSCHYGYLEFELCGSFCWRCVVVFMHHYVIPVAASMILEPTWIL